MRQNGNRTIRRQLIAVGHGLSLCQRSWLCARMLTACCGACLLPARTGPDSCILLLVYSAHMESALKWQKSIPLANVSRMFLFFRAISWASRLRADNSSEPYSSHWMGCNYCDDT